jgi:hypothetical protein
MNPRLSDFSYEQITIAYKGLCAHKQQIQDRIEGYRSAELITRMFSAEILQLETELDDLGIWIAQLYHAKEEKKRETIVASN